MNTPIEAAVEQHGAVVIPLHQKRVGPAEGAAYQMALFDGSLALKVAARRTEEPPQQTETPETLAVSRTAVIVARALLEVLSGWRPASQLSRWTSHALQQDLERRAPRRPTGSRLTLRRIRVSEPAAGVAEVCALADDPAQGRVRAMALRLENRQGTLVVTRLQAG